MGEGHPRTMPATWRAILLQTMGGVRKAEAGRTLDGKTYDEYPEIAHVAVASLNERTQLLATIGA